MPQATRTHKQEIKGNNKLEFEFSSRVLKRTFHNVQKHFSRAHKLLTAFLQQINSFI